MPIAVRFALAYQPITDTVHFADAEMGHRYLILKGREFGTTTRVISQLGPVNVSSRELESPAMG
jgi:hypothetical protein